MERLLGWIGITYLSVLAVVFYLGINVAIVLSVVFLMLFLTVLLVKKLRKNIVLPVVAFVALLACVVNIAYTFFVYYDTVSEYSGYSGKVTATMIEEPYYSYGSYHYRFESRKIGEKDDKVRFVVNYSELLNIEPFDTVDIDIDFHKNNNSQNLSKRCFLVGSFGYEKPEITFVSHDNTLRYHGICLRQKIRDALSDVLSKDAFELCSALLIGDKYALSDEVRQQFKEAGVSHMIVVSGMHFSILSAFLFFLARKIRKLKYLFLSLSVAFIIVFMLVTGFTPSVVRSGVMLFICAVGLFISRDPYSLNSLSVAAIVLTLFNPYSVGDIGLILSFASTFSILTLCPILREKFYYRTKTEIVNYNFFTKILLKIRNLFIDVLCMNISAFVVSLPLSIIFFSSTSTVSIISSFILFIPIQFLLITTLLLAIFYFLPFSLWGISVLSFVAEILSDIVFRVVEFFASLPFSYVRVNNNYVYLWLLLSAVLFLLMLLTKSKNRTKIFALSSAVVFLVGYVSAGLICDTVSTFNVYDVDGGTAVMYESGDITAVLSFDCNSYNRYNTIRKLENSVTDIDFCSSVSNTANSANSLKALSKEFAISDVLLYDTKRTVELSDTVKKVTVPENIHTVQLSQTHKVTYQLIDDVYITYLDTGIKTVLVLPYYIDVLDIPQHFRNADIIVMNNCPLNFELLSCDTLIITAKSDYAYHIMEMSHGISNRVLLSSESDIKLLMEV